MVTSPPSRPCAPIVSGLGLGLVYPAIVTSVLAEVHPGEEGAATGVLLTATQVANALGIAIVTAAWDATHSLALALTIAGALAIGVTVTGRGLSVARTHDGDRAAPDEDPARCGRQAAGSAA